jgi:hypothetical protein
MPRLPAAGSVTATMNARSALRPAVMNCFVPSITQRAPFFTARVVNAAASEPACGSVSRKALDCTPEASGLSNRSFCASVPCSSSAAQLGELFTHIMLHRPQSPAAISSTASAYETMSAPAPPHSGATHIPIRPSGPIARRT